MQFYYACILSSNVVSKINQGGNEPKTHGKDVSADFVSSKWVFGFGHPQVIWNQKTAENVCWTVEVVQGACLRWSCMALGLQVGS